MTRLLMPDSLDSLRAKLTAPAAPLAPWWNHFTTLARREPQFFSPYTILTALVTDLPADRELARQSFLHFINVQKEGLISQDAQFHTHVVSAPLARWAIYYDWVVGTGILSPAEEKAFREYLLDYTFIFPWPQANSRARQFDNQLFSNAFAASVVGYVLGIRHGDSPAARRLFRTGLDALRFLFTILPPGGYSPEGSTYHEHVVMPLTLLAGLFVQEATGETAPPGSGGLKLMLETSCRMIGPGGLMPPWDHYGFQPASIKSPLAYLARLTRDPNPLAVIRDQGLWYRTSLPAWDIDDRLWTLVFWPSDIDTGSADAKYPAWMEPEIGGALQDKSTRLRLFQYWDETGGVPNAGRSQVDPNAISLDVAGSPILLDGHGNPTPDPVTIPQETALNYVGKRVVESVQEYAFSSWQWKMPTETALKGALAGNVGQSNALTFDREFWYVPLKPCRGVGEVLHNVGPLQVVRGEAAEYYTDRYDVTSVARSSLLVGGRFVLVTDRVKSKTPHTITWQAYVRQTAVLNGSMVTLRTPEFVGCTIIPLQKGESELTPIIGYPKIGNDRSALFRHTISATDDARIDVLIVPQMWVETALELSADWRREGSNTPVDLRDAYLTDTAAPDAPRRFTRSFNFKPEADHRGNRRHYILRVEASAQDLLVTLNGKQVSSVIKQEKGHWQGSAMLLSLFYYVGDALVDGENKLEFAPPFFHGESVLGPITLLAQINPDGVGVAPIGDSAYRVTTAAGTDLVLSENRAGEVEFAGGKTDARYAVLTAEGGFAGAAVRKLALPGVLNLTADAPCDFAWNPTQTTLTRSVNGSTLQLAWKSAELRIQTGGCLDVTYLGSTPHRLVVDLPTPQIVFVNGVSLGAKHGRAVALPLTPNAAPTPALPTTIDDVFALIQQTRAHAAQTCTTLLRGNDWRLQVAAADVAGVMQLSETVPALLEAFLAGECELPYPPLKTWWRGSKMLRNAGSVEGDDASVPLPLGVKRWRVRCATTIALGKIGDARAVAPIEQAMSRCTDFFPVTSQLAVALGRLGSPSSIDILDRHFNHAEVNTKLHARLSIALLKGEITRDEFEAKAGLA